jgi:hypothetical protein
MENPLSPGRRRGLEEGRRGRGEEGAREEVKGRRGKGRRSEWVREGGREGDVEGESEKTEG